MKSKQTMETIKVIDLLVRIANENEIPEKIKHENYIWLYDKDWKDYKNAQVGFSSYLISSRYHKTDFLNEKVEIIEDTPKEDKKIEDRARFQYSQIPSWFDIKGVIRVVNENFERHQQALNKIIDKINGDSNERNK